MIALAGVVLVVALWHTSLVAAVYAAWRLVRPQASARALYGAAAAALVAAAMLTVATPVWLTAGGTGAAAGHATEAKDAAPSDAPASASRERPLSLLSAPVPARGLQLESAARVVGTIWLVAAAALVCRLLGGWLLVHRVRRTATPIADGSSRAALDRVRLALGVPTAIALAESADVDAPVVVGARRPTLLLPRAGAHALAGASLDAVLAHEVAHVDRRDYVVNLAQSWVEAVLCFSPAVWWLSRQMREAREYCCDDIAVARSGDARRVAEALAQLAALGAYASRHGVGAAGPPLILRVRRLLEGVPMRRSIKVRTAGLGMAIALMAVTAQPLTTAATAVTQSVQRSTQKGEPLGAAPIGYFTEQPASGVWLRQVDARFDQAKVIATVQNLTNQRIVGLTFVALIESVSGPRTLPVTISTSPEVSVSIEPGQSAEVQPDVLTQEQMRELMTAKGRSQVMFGLASVKYVNGASWTVTPNSAATRADEALALPPPEIARSMVVPRTPVKKITVHFCVDDQKREYAQGAIVPIRYEPGNVTQCSNGRWVDYPPAPPAK